MDKDKLLNAIGFDILNELKKALGTHFKSGDLSTYMSFRIENGKLNIYLLPYWKYVEYGTPGQREGKTSTVGGKTVSFGPKPNRKMPIKKDGDMWINLVTGEQGDFALAKHIQLYGTRPYPFVRPVIYHKLQGIVAKNVRRYAST